MLILSTKTVLAYGKVTAEGFVVLKGAKVNEHVSEKSVTPGAIKLRKKLFDDGKVKVGKINVDEQPELAMAFKAQSIPMLVVVKDGVRECR